MNDETPYVCALSGLTPTPDEEVPDILVGTSDLGDLPLLWTEVRLRRRVPNPAFIEIQAVKQALFAQELQKVPEADRAAVAPVVRIQIDAGFAALEARTPPFIEDEEILYIAPPEREQDAPGLTEAQANVYDALSVEWLDEGDEDEGVEGEAATG